MIDQQGTKSPQHWGPFTVILLSVALGPLLGMMILFSAMGIWFAWTSEGHVGAWMPLLAVHPFAWLMAYFIGGIPAAIGGTVFVLFDRYAPPSLPRIASAAAIGGITMYACWIAYGGTGSGSDHAGILSAIGALAAAFLAAVTKRYRYSH